MSKTIEQQANEVRELLGQVETELHHTDESEQQIADAADGMLDHLRPELARRAGELGPAGNDPDREAEYLYGLAHQRRAVQVRALAERYLRKKR